MPAVFPFRAVQYRAALDAAAQEPLEDLIAPPYDVLDAAEKTKLESRSAHNVVRVDLPHIPAKELGPPGAYAGAAELYRRWLSEGTLIRRERPALFVYRQTFEFAGATHQRTGMACTIETQPFGPRPGGGVLPHEQTFSGPKEDRFALMKATRAQLSPIFGMHPDEDGAATALLREISASRDPDASATTGDGVLHEVWAVSDDAAIGAYKDALAGEDVFIADGHHRYTTGLNYLAMLEERGPAPADHPARRSMFVLVGMSDPGMVIGPTHRVLGGMSGYSIDAFLTAAMGKLSIHPVVGGLGAVEAALEAGVGQEQNVLGLYDFASRKCFIAHPAEEDPLRKHFGEKSRPWRTLDVAIVQHLVVEEICEPKLNAGQSVKWAFPHSIDEVVEIGEGREKGSGGGRSFAPQLAVIVRPTPMSAVREISKANELMPQKSTFFYPKLATGLFINPLE